MMKIYEDSDLDEVVYGKAIAFFKANQYLEASNWGIYEEEGYVYTDCLCCPRQRYDSIEEALNSLSVFPDQYQRVSD